MAFLQLQELLRPALLLLMCCCLSNNLSPPAALALDCFLPDLQALRAFARHIAWASEDDYNSDAGSLEELWGPGNNCCSWQGINCSIAITNSSGGPAPARVSSLVLSIFRFSNLSFTSNFLQPLCNLSLLSTLHLQFSSASTARPQFYTHIPACLGHLLNLRKLSLLYMHLQGPLPSSFSHLLHLQHLEMPNIDGPLGTLLSGTLLPISNLPNLTYVDFLGCALSGPLPPFQTPLLHFLGLSDNFLNSTLLAFTRLSNLPSLTELNLANNDISGPIPSSIARLSNMRSIDLSSNSLSGQISPSFCKLARLVWLDLHDSKGQGHFNTSLDSLVHCKFINLTHLSLAGNGFRGPFPRWIGHSPSLDTLDLSGNEFRGSLPDEWKNLRNITDLDLSGNFILPSVQYDTKLPEWLFRNPLIVVRLVSCGLQTQDLSCSSKLSLLNQSLYYLDLSDNDLTGRDTLECLALHNFTAQFSLYLSRNPLSIVLSDLLLPPRVTSLYLSSCNLTMDLPSLLTNLGLNCGPKHRASPEDIDLSHNGLVGEIPSSLGLCNKDLKTIRLHNNVLVGHIPVELGGLASLEILTLNNNQLKGTIPASIVGLSSLILLDLSYNELEGNLNTLFSISNTTNLRVVLLSYNRINGSIPLSFGTFMPDLQLIDFSNNRLTGVIPEKLHLPYLRNLQARDMNIFMHPSRAMGDLYGADIQLVIKGVKRSYPYVRKAMTSLDLSSNFLEGGIPAEIGDLSALLYLNLSHNRLSGPIPSALSKLSQLQALDLSSNELEGPLPSQLSNLTKLSNFNVSYNAGLRGSIPQGPQFEANESYKGDLHLCGFPALQDCKPVLAPHTTTQAAHARSAVARWIDEWIALPGLSLGLVVGFGTTLFLLHCRQ